MQSEQTPPSHQPEATQRNKLVEMLIPINRSGWAIAAGYVALFTIPFIVVGPVAVLLGILALRDFKKSPNKAGRGRAWFAIIYGMIGTVILTLMAVLLLRHSSLEQF